MVKGHVGCSVQTQTRVCLCFQTTVTYFFATVCPLRDLT